MPPPAGGLFRRGRPFRSRGTEGGRGTFQAGASFRGGAPLGLIGRRCGSGSLSRQQAFTGGVHRLFEFPGGPAGIRGVRHRAAGRGEQTESVVSRPGPQGLIGASALGADPRRQEPRMGMPPANRREGRRIIPGHHQADSAGGLPRPEGRRIIP